MNIVEKANEALGSSSSSISSSSSSCSSCESLFGFDSKDVATLQPSVLHSLVEKSDEILANMVAAKDLGPRVSLREFMLAYEVDKARGMITSSEFDPPAQGIDELSPAVRCCRSEK
jgi:hypothetical protein